MARRGKKRKIVTREGNGRAKRSIQPKPVDVRETVFWQPHRRGSDSNRLCSPVGRLLHSGAHHLAGLSLEGLYEAANRFERAYHSWLVAIGAPRPFANGPRSSGQGMSPAETREAADTWRNAWDVLNAAGHWQSRCVMNVVIEPQEECWRPSDRMIAGCISGLLALAQHFGIRILGEDKAAPQKLLNVA